MASVVLEINFALLIDVLCKRYAAGAAKFGPKARVLINNAALFVFESVETASAEDWDRSAAVNIKGHALVTKHCIPLMKVRTRVVVSAAAVYLRGSLEGITCWNDLISFRQQVAEALYFRQALAVSKHSQIAQRTPRQRGLLCN